MNNIYLTISLSTHNGDDTPQGYSRSILLTTCKLAQIKLFRCSESNELLGEFVKLRKATVGFISVLQSACNSLAPTGQIFLEI